MNTDGALLNAQTLHRTGQRVNVPDDQLAIETGSADTTGTSLVTRIDAHTGDCILMDRLQIGVGILRTRVPIQRLENPHSRDATLFLLGRLVQLGGQHNATSVEGIDQRNAAMASYQNRLRRDPLAAEERQVFRLELDRNVSTVCLRNVDRAVVANPANPVAIGREAHAMNPTTSGGRILELGQHLPQGFLRTPSRRFRVLLDVLDVSGKHPNLVIGRTGHQQHIVRMPIQRCHRRTDRLLDVLRNPPIVLRLKVAHRNQPGAGSHRELVLQRRPTDARRSPVDPQQNQRRLPLAVVPLGPNVGIPIDGASHNPIGIRSPIDAHDAQIMLVQHIQQLPFGALPLVDVDLVVVRRDGNFCKHSKV